MCDDKKKNRGPIFCERNTGSLFFEDFWFRIFITLQEVFFNGHVFSSAQFWTMLWLDLYLGYDFGYTYIWCITLDWEGVVRVDQCRLGA